jgi:hypothetical protein
MTEKPKKKMPKKPKKKTKKPRYQKDKSVKQNVNVKNIISAGGGAAGAPGGSSSYPIPIPQYIQSPIPQSFQQTNTENINTRSLINEIRQAISRPEPAPAPLPNIPDTVYAGTRDVSRQFDPVIADLPDDISEMTEIEQPELKIPFGSNIDDPRSNLSVFLQDIEENPSLLPVGSFGETPIIPEQNPIITPKPNDPNIPLIAQVEEGEKKSRAKKEYGEPYLSNNRLLARSNFTGQTLDITDWPMWDQNSNIRLDPNNQGYHINIKSGIYGKGRKNVEKLNQPKAKPKVNLIQGKTEQVPVFVTAQPAL